MSTLTDKSCAYTEWQTPPFVIDAVHLYFGDVITLDPATSDDNPTFAQYFFTPKTPSGHGLERRWFGDVFVNPPYGKALRDWVAKIHSEAASGVHIVALLPGQRFETDYWQEHVLNSYLDAICFIRRRLAFINPKTGNPVRGNPYGSMLYVYNGSVRQAKDKLGALGRVMEVHC